MVDVAKQVSICGDLLGTGEVQFRWMGTAFIDGAGEMTESSDTWALSNVTANLITENDDVSLFEDSFGSEVLK